VPSSEALPQLSFVAWLGMPNSCGNVVKGIGRLENQPDSQYANHPSDDAQSRQERYGQHGDVPKLYYAVRWSRIHCRFTPFGNSYLFLGDR
jgi:hypothetical protein